MTDSRLALLSERLVAFRDSKGRPDPVGSGFVASLARPGRKGGERDRLWQVRLGRPELCQCT
jgi:hypothetical protein